MAVNNNGSRRSYSPSSGTTELSFPFKIYKTTDLEVYKNSTLLTITADYTVSILSDPQEGGTVTLIVASSVNDKYVIQRVVPDNQTEDFSTGGEFTSTNIVNALDKLTIQNQQNGDTVDNLVPKYSKDLFVQSKDLTYPLLSGSQFHMKNAANTGFIAASLEESSGYSTLRSELASETSGTDGAKIVGYNSTATGGTTVHERLNILDGKSFLDYGAVGNGSTDCTEAFNDFLADLTQTTLYIPDGDFLFNSKPNNITRKIKIIGKSFNYTVLKLNYDEGTSTNGMIHAIGNVDGLEIHNIRIESNSGKTGGSAISILSNASNNVTDVIIKNVIVTGSGDWEYNLYIDGSANSSNIYNLLVNNFIGSKSTTACLYLRYVKYANVEGEFSSNGQSILFGGSAATDNEYINLYARYSSKLTIKYCTNITIHSDNVTTLTTDSTANNVSVYGNVTTVSGAWVNSKVIGSKNFDYGVSGNNVWYTLPSGIIMQIARFSVTNTSTNFTLPKAFKTTNFGVCGAVPDGDAIMEQDISANTLTTVSLKHYGAATTIPVICTIVGI